MTTLTQINRESALAANASRGFNNWLWDELRQLGRDLAAICGEDLIALVLGGGFGRGDGCVVFSNGREMPYNDVDLFLITTTPFLRHGKATAELAHKYEHILGVAVDFSRPQTLRMIAQWPATLMWQELALGHRVLYGDADVLLNSVPNCVLQPLPAIEAGRLLLNRGAGVAWAQLVALGLAPQPDPTFVARNYFKCAMAIPDALLIAQGRYSSDPREKLRHISYLSEKLEIVRESQAVCLLKAALAFRRSPASGFDVAPDLHELARTWLRVFLWIESQRSTLPFVDARDYAGWSGLREPYESGHIRRLAANLRRGRFNWQHPREGVYRTLPLALDALSTNAPDFAPLANRALELWTRAQ